MGEPARKLMAQPGDAAVADVLGAMADELERTRSLGLRVEGAICVAALAASADVSVIEELQQFDLILQRVAALREFALELARRCNPVHEINVESALARITLEDMRSRLAGIGQGEDAVDEWEMI